MVTGSFNWPAMNPLLEAWSGPATFVATDQSTANIVARGNVLRGTSQAITMKTVSTDGTVQTNQVVIPAVPVGTPVTFFTMRDGTGTGSLLLFIDEAIDLPFTPNGLDMVVQPDWLTLRGWFRG